ncbi:MAG: serine/threonine protein kinase [Polyangiaceae bacterium]|nr:serine/threonine protein kinase [Polyangiaceae bacterium]
MSPRTVGRYQVYEAFAAGGMASVHLGRLKGQAGFARTVAIKQLHPSFAEDASTVSTILDEARIASRIQHPNVVSTLDVVVEGTDILLVLEYVHGESFARLLRGSAEPPPVEVALAVVTGMLHGLHAAHEAKSETGEPLGIVHRDVSPQNVLVGADGLARVLDFGIAKARGRLQTTREGQVKGKLAYMAPEQIKLGEVSRRTDVFAAGIVLWEALTGERLFTGDNEGHLMMRVVEAKVEAPSARRSEIPAEIDAVVLRALSREPSERFGTAREMALALEATRPIASTSVVGHWVEQTASATLEERAARVRAIEAGPGSIRPAPLSSRDEPTRTDAGAAAREPDSSGEVTKTENHAISMERVVPSKPSSKRGLFVAAGIAALVGVAAAVVLTLRPPAEVPAAGVPAANMTVPSSTSVTPAASSSPEPAAEPPAASTAAVSSSSAPSAPPKSPPRAGARPPASSTAAPPAAATATAKEAWKPPRFN